MNDGHTALDRLQSFPNIWFFPPYKPTSNEAGPARPAFALVVRTNKEQIAVAPDTIPHNAKIATNCTPAFVVGSDNDAKIGRFWFRRQAYSSTETLIHQQAWRRGALDSSAELEPDEFRRLRRKRFF